MKNCDTCANTKCVNRRSDIICCSSYKPKVLTNADRIRAMSDEELAEWIMKFVMACCVQSGIEDPEWHDGSEEAMLNWLKSPMEGE